MKFDSLHSYLEWRFSQAQNVTDAMVKKAKADYWRLYYKHYRRQQRKTRKEFVLGFDSEKIKFINQNRGKLPISKFLYRAVEKELMTGCLPLLDNELLSLVNQNLMQLINLMEEVLDSSNATMPIEVFEKMEQLEIQISRLLKSKV